MAFWIAPERALEEYRKGRSDPRSFALPIEQESGPKAADVLSTGTRMRFVLEGIIK